MSALWDKPGYQWCLTCGKPVIRCFCKVTQPAADLEPLKQEKLTIRMPATSSNPADNGGAPKRWRRKGRQYVGVGRL